MLIQAGDSSLISLMFLPVFALEVTLATSQDEIFCEVIKLFQET